MKYLTKEWYNKMQCNDIHLFLKINDNIEEFKEDFYQEIYQTERKKYIEFQSNFTEYEKFRNMYLMTVDNKESLTENKIREEFDKYKKETFKNMSIEESFDYRQNNIIELLKSKLPSSILNKVKDIRLLALNYATIEEYELIKEYCENNKKYVNDKINEYSKLEKETFKNNSLQYIKESFHDCFIIDIKNDKNNLIIELDNEQGFTDKTSVIFKNYDIILDENIKNTWWLYNEIYKVENKYEIHILTSSEELKELIIKCDDVIVK